MSKQFLADLHIHSNFSDGKMTIADIVDLYGKKGFSAIAITDHLADDKSLTGIVARQLNFSLFERNIDQYLQTIKDQAKRAWNEYNMLLIPGIEITLNSWSKKNGAHILFLGVEEYINPNRPIVEILTTNTNYFSIAAHPLWEASYEFKTTYLWDNNKQLKPYFNAWECATGSHFSKEVFTSGLATIASSDFHGGQFTSSWRSRLYIDELSTESVFNGIETKKTEPVWI